MKVYSKERRSTVEGLASYFLTHYRSRAKTLKLEFNLDKEWILEKLKRMKCEETNNDLDLNLEQKEGFHNPFRPSIDRVNNSKGYTKDNCKIVCVIYNKSKSDYSKDVLLKMIKNWYDKGDLKNVIGP